MLGIVSIHVLCNLCFFHIDELCVVVILVLGSSRIQGVGKMMSQPWADHVIIFHENESREVAVCDLLHRNPMLGRNIIFLSLQSQIKS